MTHLWKSRSALAVAAVLVLTVLSFAPAPAAGAAVCQLAGTVTLSTNTELSNASAGSGTFAPGAGLICAGSVSGQGQISGVGDFAFCRHNFAGGGNAACHGPTSNGSTTLDQALDPVFDTLNMFQGVAAHFKGQETAVGFAIGGTCTFAFEGHAITAQAEITIKSFTCPSAGLSMTGTASASSAFVVNRDPGCPTVCFKQVVFLGTIELAQV